MIGQMLALLGHLPWKWESWDVWLEGNLEIHSFDLCTLHISQHNTLPKGGKERRTDRTHASAVCPHGWCVPTRAGISPWVYNSLSMTACGVGIISSFSRWRDDGIESWSYSTKPHSESQVASPELTTPNLTFLHFHVAWQVFDIPWMIRWESVQTLWLVFS